MGKYKIGIDVEITMNGEDETISYNLSVNANTEEEAIQIIKNKYGLNSQEWNIEAIVEHLEEFIIDIKNTNFEINELLFVESLDHEYMDTFDVN